MTRLTLRFDLRTPPFARCPDDYYRTALDMAEWADAHGFNECMLSEHHGEEDGYLPSPLVMAAAIAARTRRMRIRISALILPLHDPLRIAEDVAVLDRLSGGRIELVCVAGFRPGEFAQFDKPFAARIRLLEHGIATLKQAWSGEPFTYLGRKVRITPARSSAPILHCSSAALRSRRPVARHVSPTASYRRFRNSTRSITRPVRPSASLPRSSAIRVRPPRYFCLPIPPPPGRASPRTHCTRPTPMRAGTPKPVPSAPISRSPRPQRCANPVSTRC
ncbi:MAG: LLM class flavin-dependent oxidoreductase [Gammaproteobacteria bacterium]|nr:LLM class flavin-dependent oxidoreductase [Gammaproteobacteria bacterium]